MALKIKIYSSTESVDAVDLDLYDLKNKYNIHFRNWHTDFTNHLGVFFGETSYTSDFHPIFRDRYWFFEEGHTSSCSYNKVSIFWPGLHATRVASRTVCRSDVFREEIFDVVGLIL